jgi:5-methylcytosine-specific restriction protein A
MSRHEFSKATKRAAVARAKGRCEASGPVYGLEPEGGCWSDLAHGFEIDHYPLPATMEGSDVLANAVVCCMPSRSTPPPLPPQRYSNAHTHSRKRMI